MSTELSDVSAGSPPPPPDSTGGAAPSAATEEQKSSPTTGSVSHDTAEKNADAGEQASGSLASSDAVPDYLKDFPSMEELEQNKSERYAQALLGIRPAHDALLEKHRTLSQAYEPFKPIVGDSTPEQLQAKLEIVDGLFSSATDPEGKTLYGRNGLPIPDAKPGVTRLVQDSPDTAYAILDALAASEIDGSPLGDQYLNWRLNQLGLDPANLQQYAEWEKTGAPVATAAVDLSNIPQQYHEVFKSLPPAVQQDIVNAEPDAREHYLKREQQAFEGEKANREAVQTQAREAQATIQRNTHTAVMGKFETGFNQFLEHLSGWKPTADDAVNRAYHIETASTLVNLLDPNMAFANRMLYETLGMPPDAEIPQLSQQFQQQLGLAELYKSRGDQINAANAQRSADSAYMRLVAKLNGVAGKLIEHKGKVAKAAEGAKAADGQQGRTHVQGQPGALAANGGRSGSWTQAFYD